MRVGYLRKADDKSKGKIIIKNYYNLPTSYLIVNSQSTNL